ncbi:DUF6702 family protein [Lutibacter sp.]|uniref:DUF6702 family protein n=1 Tax=Lutibacter sp. TaxID=1925666 RepID=UPI003524EC46
MSFNYIGKEYEDDLVRFYLEIPSINDFSSFEISNTILFSELKEQKNIIKIKIEKEYKTMYLDRENTKGMLKF